MSVQGFCEARFDLVREEFERNFAERGEVGASACVFHEGEIAVDLWGGLADRHAQTPWERDTLGVVFSCTKGAVALCLHLLVSRGLVDLDAPVARYWPEFGQADKHEIPVRWLLSHQAGLPAIRQPLRPGGLFDWDYVVGVLAAEPPFWPPGHRQGYAATTFGHLVGEVVRRVSGRDLGSFFRDEVAAPLGLDFHLGLSEADEGRVAPVIRPDPLPRGEKPWRFVEVANEDPNSIQSLTVRNTGWGHVRTDSREAHAAVLPSQGGITNARGLAGMYAPLSLGGNWGKVTLADALALARMQEVASATAVDATLLVGMRFSLGFVKSADNRTGPPGARDSVILSSSAFGHPGLGGSLGFADPEGRFSFGYTMNKLGRGVLLTERGQALVDAVYRSLGYASNESGCWRRE